MFCIKCILVEVDIVLDGLYWKHCTRYCVRRIVVFKYSGRSVVFGMLYLALEVLNLAYFKVLESP